MRQRDTGARRSSRFDRWPLLRGDVAESLFVAVLTVGVSVLAIATMMLFGLGFEGLL